MPEVAESVPATVVERRGRLGLVVVVFEWPDVAKPDRADLPCGQLVAVVIEDVRGPEHGSADRALVAHPVGRADHEESGAIAARIEIDDLGPQPVDHLLLDVSRAWRGGVDDETENGHIVRPTPGPGHRTDE